MQLRFRWRAERPIAREPVVVIGFVLFGFAIAALAAIRPHSGSYLAMFALAGVLGALPSNAALASLLAQWFQEKCGFWLGFTAGVGNGVESALMPAIAAIFLVESSFRGAFLGIVALIILFAAPIAWVTLRVPPQSATVDEGNVSHSGSRLTLRQALGRPLFWVIFSSVPLVAGSMTAVFANTVSIMISRDLTLAQAMGVVASFALICAVGQPFAGWLLDRSDRPRIVAPFYAVSALGVATFIMGRSDFALMVGGGMAGIGLGADYCLMAYMLSRYFGLRAMGAIAGLAYAAVLTVNAFTPLGLNFVYEMAGSYGDALVCVIMLLIYGLFVLVLLPRYPGHETFAD
jgi:MFS family permease